MKRGVRLIIFAMIIVVFLVSNAHSSVVLYTNPTGDPFEAYGTGGTKFTVGNNDFIVEALGIWDEGGDGLISSHDIGLWDASGSSLLASATVASGTAATEESGFRWVSLSSPITLSSSTSYVIGATYLSTEDPEFHDDQLRSSPNVTVSPGFTLEELRYIYASTLTFPGVANWGSLTGAFGPNIKGTVVPIPGAVWLLGSGLIGIVGIRRKMKQ